MQIEYKSVIFGCALFVCFVIMVAICICMLHRRQVSKLMEQLDRMIDAAIEGKFQESRFDESMLSSVESKLAHYLSSNEVSAEHVKEEKEKIKELLGDISHQTKTPIANLLLYSELLAEQVEAQKKKRKSEELDAMSTSAQAIHKQSERLKFLIASLVKTSRLETGVLALTPVPNDVEEMIHHAVEQVRPKAEKRNISVEVKLEALRSGTMIFDLKWTVEALYNILDNGVKYAYPGTTLLVKGYSYTMFYRIDVTDEGIPIMDSEQEKVFQRFYRGKNVSQQEGVGIGLYITRQIVSSQDGYLKVQSDQQGKNTFSIYLPIK